MVFIIFIVFAHWVIFGWLFLINQRRLFLTLGIFVRKRFRYHPFSSWANPQNNQIVFNHKQQDHSFRGHHLENNLKRSFTWLSHTCNFGKEIIGPLMYWNDHSFVSGKTSFNRWSALMIELFVMHTRETTVWSACKLLLIGINENKFFCIFYCDRNYLIEWVTKWNIAIVACWQKVIVTSQRN